MSTCDIIKVWDGTFAGPLRERDNNMYNTSNVSNLTNFGANFSKQRDLFFWEVYLKDYAEGKINFSEACNYLKHCFTDVTAEEKKRISDEEYFKNMADAMIAEEKKTIIEMSNTGPILDYIDHQFFSDPEMRDKFSDSYMHYCESFSAIMSKRVINEQNR